MFLLTKLHLQTRLGLPIILGLMVIFHLMGWQGARLIDTALEVARQERLTLARSVALHLDQDLERTLGRLAQVAAFPTINLEDGGMEPEADLFI